MPKRCRRIAPYAAATAAALVGALVPAAPGHADLPTVSFFVVGPDGLPVAQPYVMTWVLGGDRTIVHQSRGTSDGRIDVTVPDDPVADARKATGLAVNLLSLVTDRQPGLPGLASMAVATAINATGIPDLPVDVAGTGGQVYTLVPGLTDFYEAPTALPVGEENPDEPDCPEVTYHQGYPCQVNDWPDWVNRVRVPIADNFGAGTDIYATIEYQSAQRSTTSIAFSGGQSGFYEARGGTTYIEQDTLGFDWGQSGPKANQKAMLVTKFQRTRDGICWWDTGGTGSRHCALTTTYLPYQGVAADGAAWYHNMNDTLDPALDCKLPVQGYWDKGVGTETGQSYAFSLGPSENWTTSLPFAETGYLHAQSHVTAESTSGYGFKRRWHVVQGKQYKYHWVMVKGGMAAYNRLLEGGGTGCPENTVQDVYTHASDYPNGDPVIVAREAVETRNCDPFVDAHLADGVQASGEPVPAPTVEASPGTVAPSEPVIELDTAPAPAPAPSPTTGTTTYAGTDVTTSTDEAGPCS